MRIGEPTECHGCGRRAHRPRGAASLLELLTVADGCACHLEVSAERLGTRTMNDAETDEPVINLVET